jgi:hypothetical protein
VSRACHNDEPNVSSRAVFGLTGQSNLHRLGRPRISRSFRRISHDVGQSHPEPGGCGPGSLVGAREVGRVVDLRGVPDESRRVNRWYPDSTHQGGQRVADAVVPYLRTSAVRKHREAAECDPA